VDLLLIQNKVEDGEEYDYDDILIEPICVHYVWITNMSALIGAEVSKGQHKKFLCTRYLHYFCKPSWRITKLTVQE